MKIKIDHINLTVMNLNDSVKWYSRVFGFEVVERGTGMRGQPWAIVANADSMLAMNEYPKRRMAEDDSSESFHRLNHFGIRVDDLGEWQAKLKEFNLKLNYGGVIDYPHSKSWYVVDPSGHEIEVSYSSGQPLRF